VRTGNVKNPSNTDIGNNDDATAADSGGGGDDDNDNYDYDSRNAREIKELQNTAIFALHT